ncbi:putative tail tip protein [Pseudomonas phage PA7]|uniref:Tail tip protein n=1 Tax=Pseudomonas phage PA7 TaxID=347330 RepID=A0AAE7V9Q7_9CAUD|nr:putative tail tip protein [Pseudomonas phage PA7]
MAHGETGLYPFDPNGTNPQNFIKGERQTLQVPDGDDYYFIIPFAAPFFVDSLRLFNPLTNQTYVEGVDYLIGHWFIEAMESIGRPIAGSIRIMKRSINAMIGMDYRTIGGQWGFSNQQILAELARKQYNPLIRSWGAIGPLPASFPPLEHNQPIDSLVGSKEILEGIEGIIEAIRAAAAGTTDQHIRDYNNPHRVTKAQVGLALVPNYAMATDQQHLDANRNDLFTNPRGTLALVNKFAVNPLNAHIAARGNVHDLTAADINLGNVPNYPAATPTTAVDVTNDSVLLTPYTASILYSRIGDASRINELEEKLNQHISNENNPHVVTADQVNAYTKTQVDQLLAGLGGGDASTFGGLTPEQWKDEFPSFGDIERMAAGYNANWDDAQLKIDTLPVIVDDTSEYDRMELIQGVTAGFHAYAGFNSWWDCTIVRDDHIVHPKSPANPYVVMPERLGYAQESWVSHRYGQYWVENGVAKSACIDETKVDEMIPIPVEWTAPIDGNIPSSIWANKTSLYMLTGKFIFSSTGESAIFEHQDLYRCVKGGTSELLVPAANKPWALFTNTEDTYPGEMTVVVNIGPASSADYVYTAYGIPSFVSAFNDFVNNTIKPLNHVIDSMSIGCTHIIIHSIDPLVASEDYTSESSKVHVMEIIRNGNDTSFTVISPLWFDGRGNDVTANVYSNPIGGVSGLYTHYTVMYGDGQIAFFGNNDNGQCDVDDHAGPYIQLAAGHNFTVTVNTLNQVMFWGDSPDNSLLWNGRGTRVKHIEPTPPTGP